ncbi:bile acid:sodium symporter family protein [Lactonifactor longoviformis]|uniref:Bile acid:Na+ symporter, BASS family n=1 Tax=Lactonifactor longoviformis DSM 17459 TaxID=1122155 RepID=A0A1M4VW02_9CLOT|nr:bile acid:sodium symporter family protein [Lactonifactor longoviformis]POP33259.1 bile acid:sodium symporter family protein [Lactonifactor longoviformis]SHE73033.1 bile acid:Na+ symporter, BASS family [Lactonifactor longoviformis DSM 17459]
MNAAKKSSKWLSDHTSFFVIAVAVVTFFLPNLFSWVQGNNQSLILGIIMFSMGLTLSTDDFRILAKRPLDIFIGAAAQYLIMPFLAFGLATALHLPNEIAVGLILVGCCPGGVSSNIMSYLCRGDVPFSVGMTTASTLLSPIMTPMMVLLLAGTRIEVDAAAMLFSILKSVIIPVFIGFVLNTFWGERKAFKDIQQVMPGISVIGLALIVGGVIALQGSNFFQSGVVIFLAVFLHNGLGYLLGYGVGMLTKMSTAKKRTIAIEVGMQNAGLATNLAAAHFATAPQAAMACAVSCVWHSISGTILAGWFARKDAKKAERELPGMPEKSGAAIGRTRLR